MLIMRHITAPPRVATQSEQEVIIAHRLFLTQMGRTLARGGAGAAIDAVILMAADTLFTINTNPDYDQHIIDQFSTNLANLLKNMRNNNDDPRVNP